MARMNQEIAKKAVLLLPEIFRRLGQSISQEGTSHTFKNIKNAPSQTGESFYTLSKNIFFLPARAEKLFTPSKNIKFFWPIRREFFKPSQGIFSSSSQPGQKFFSHLQKILNSFGQSGESISNPLKEYFLPPASQGRISFHTFKKY